MARTTTKNLNPSAAVRRDPAEEYLTTALKPARQQYTRFNVFVSEDNVPTYEAFKIYCKDQGYSVSELINILMAQTVEKHAAEIDEAKERFEKARKHYKK